MKRHMIVCDVETNGLNPQRHEAIEVAWWNLDTDERGSFIPLHSPSVVLGAAEIQALKVNRYIDRILGQEQDHDGKELFRLHNQFVRWPDPRDEDAAVVRHSLAGSNPAFDARFLAKLFLGDDDRCEHEPEPWHHRLWDLSAYAAGVLALDELPGLARVCSILGVEQPNHTARGDVESTGLCFKRLREIASRQTGASS